MNNRKIRFNWIDVAIILILIAVAAVVMSYFVFNGREETDVVQTPTTKIQYVVELNNIDENFADILSVGQEVEDAVTRQKVGKIVGVQSVPYRKISFDFENEEETVTEVENRIMIRITIEADAVESDRDFTVSGCVIKVGKLYSLMTPEMYCVGYCIALDSGK
ncbi:MAG: DUF4330 family protein [Ruminococcaceae bacterium]|nr:DUF4330 family protein [Oscillospiraceae bacterium]